MPFIYFPKLPAELRLKIWMYALPAPQVIKLTTRWKHHIGEGYIIQAHPITHDVIKRLSLTCIDAYKTIKKHFGLYFGTHLKHPLWINPSTDMLYITNSAILTALAANIREKMEEGTLTSLHPNPIQHLVMPVPIIVRRRKEYFLKDWAEMVNFLITHRGFRSITFVYNRGELDEEGICDLMQDMREDYQIAGESAKEDFDAALLDNLDWRIVNLSVLGDELRADWIYDSWPRERRPLKQGCLQFLNGSD